MSDFQNKLMPDFGDLDLAAVLDEYKKNTAAKAAEEALEKAIRNQRMQASEPARPAPQPAPAAETATSAESIAERSRRKTMDALGETLLQYRNQARSSADREPPQEIPVAIAVSAEKDAPSSPPVQKEAPSPAEPPAAPKRRSLFGSRKKSAPEPASEPVSAPEPEPKPKAAPAPAPADSSREDTVVYRPEELARAIRSLNQASQAAARKAEPAEEEASPEPIPIQSRRRRAAKAPAEEVSPPEARNTEPRKADEDENEGEENLEAEAEPREPLSRRLARSAASFSEHFLTPAVRVIATRFAQRQMQQVEAANWPDPVDIRETRELSPAKAGKYYSSLLKPLRLRCRIAAVLCIILAWINLGLPMTGMLRVSLPLEAGVSVLLTLAVMIAALDIVTAGLQQLADLRPGVEALTVTGVLLSCIDGLLVLFGIGDHLPFCAIGAVALTFALWGERLTCTALRRTFRTAASSKNPSVLTAEVLSEQGDAGLLRTDRGTTEGIVRRSESQDMCKSAYAAAAPFLFGAALLMSIVASLGGQGRFFLHTLSALLSVSSSFAAFICFPLPYAIASRLLRNSGAALAGYDGCEAIGKTRRIVITDEDLFPPGTMRFSEINVLEGVFLGKVVSSTASLLCASGSGVSALFRDLVDRRGYHIPNVDQFLIHEGGGLSGVVGGERILVGSARFMNLMGIRLPQNLQSRNAICTAISGELVGVFVIEYVPVTSVQEALVTLLRGKTQTVFAIRDFNITPLMIRQLFRMPTENFNFPSFRDRYRIGTEPVSDTSPVNAVVTRSGMLPMVEAAEAGRKLYSTCRISTILSLAGTGIGMVIMFLLCRVGSFDTASVGNVLSFMFLWALPVLILSAGQIRR